MARVMTAGSSLVSSDGSRIDTVADGVAVGGVVGGARPGTVAGLAGAARETRAADGGPGPSPRPPRKTRRRAPAGGAVAALGRHGTQLPWSWIAGLVALTLAAVVTMLSSIPPGCTESPAECTCPWNRLPEPRGPAARHCPGHGRRLQWIAQRASQGES